MPRHKIVTVKGDVDFSYYEPINDHQKQFHASKGTHKLLIGGYGSGKTYPSIHESYFICLDNPNHEFLVARNTWESLIANVEKEFLQVGEKANFIDDFNKSKHDLYLRNGCVIRFRPLGLKRSQLKGLNVCGFFIDDPNVQKHKETISFLYSRLRNSPKAQAKYFATIITANYEGHDWLWSTYMRGREPGGDDRFAYWIIPTTDNPTLDENFIADLERIHSKSWVDRFVHCDISGSYTGLIYDEFDPEMHCADLSWIENDDSLIKILAIDVGVTDPTVVLKMATDMKNIYIYDEWYQLNVRTRTLGEYLKRTIQTSKYNKILIDPSSAKREQGKYTSVRDDLRKDYRIITHTADNSVLYGIEVLKGMMTIRSHTTDEGNENKETHFYVDPDKCPSFIREMEIYRWKEPDMSEFDELSFKETPIDKDNHAMDAGRYGAVFLKKFLKGVYSKAKESEDRRQILMEERQSKLRMYKEGKYRGHSLETQRLIKLHYGRKLVDKMSIKG